MDVRKVIEDFHTKYNGKDPKDIEAALREQYNNLTAREGVDDERYMLAIQLYFFATGSWDSQSEIELKNLARKIIPVQDTAEINRIFALIINIGPVRSPSIRRIQATGVGTLCTPTLKPSRDPDEACSSMSSFQFGSLATLATGCISAAQGPSATPPVPPHLVLEGIYGLNVHEVETDEEGYSEEDSDIQSKGKTPIKKNKEQEVQDRYDHETEQVIRYMPHTTALEEPSPTTDNTANQESLNEVFHPNFVEEPRDNQDLINQHPIIPAQNNFIAHNAPEEHLNITGCCRCSWCIIM